MATWEDINELSDDEEAEEANLALMATGSPDNESDSESIWSNKVLIVEKEVEKFRVDYNKAMSTIRLELAPQIKVTLSNLKPVFERYLTRSNWINLQKFSYLLDRPFYAKNLFSKDIKHDLI
jgi:hypothetical protein